MNINIDWKAYHAAREIEITRLFADASAFVPFDLSNNPATLGDNAGQVTWSASLETSDEIMLIDSAERKEAFKDFVQSSGGWKREEIDAWSDRELNALLLQWIAGDVREAFGDADFADWDWNDYRKDAEAGQVSSRLWRADDGKVYFSIAQ